MRTLLTNSSNRTGGRTYFYLAVILLPVVTTALYHRTLEYPFVFDDLSNITENRHMRMTDFDFDSAYDVVIKSHSRHRPIANLSFAVNHYFSGYNPKPYRIINVIIHIVNGLLIYAFVFITVRLSTSNLCRESIPTPTERAGTETISDDSLPNSDYNPGQIAFWVSMIWLVHPLQTQSVTYIVQRMNSLAVMFYLFAFLSFILGRMSSALRMRWMCWGISLISWIFALGSKQIAGTLPLMIFLYEWHFFQSLSFSWLKKNLKLWGIPASLFLAVVLLYLGKSPIDQILSGYATRDFTVIERVLTQFRVVVFYISLVLLPHPGRLNLDHHFITSVSLTQPVTTLLSLVVLLSLLWLAFYWGRKKNFLHSFCILWFLINLAIESSVIGLEMAFEHRLYLPSVGGILLLGVLVARIPIRFTAGCKSLVPAVVVILLSLWTCQRNGVWKNEVTLWTDCVRKSPGKSRPHNNLGIAFKKQGKITEAIREYSTALKIKPNYPDAHTNLGNALKAQGKFSEAIQHHLTAIKIRPEFAKAHNNLANTLESQGQTSGAIDHYLEAIKSRTDDYETYYNLGLTLARQRNYSEAIQYFLEALKLKPAASEIHYHLALSLQVEGMISRAIYHYSKALKLNPNDKSSHCNLGAAFYQQGKVNQAIQRYLRAIEIDPEFAEAHKNLGIAYKKLGNVELASQHFSIARKQNLNSKNSMEYSNPSGQTVQELFEDISIE